MKEAIIKNYRLNNSVAILGLENNMQSEFQEEFVKQLNWLNTAFQDKEVLTVSQFRQQYEPVEVTILEGNDTTTPPTNNQAFFITTNKQAIIFN